MARTATKERPQEQTKVETPPPQGNQTPATTATTGKTQHPLAAIGDYMRQRAGELQYALPPHISPDRFTRVVLTALQQKPQLLACTRASLWNACMRAAQDGLLPDGREGAIVPYGENENGQRKAEIATWMPMIEGFRKKARNSGEISNWEAHIVRQRDAFNVVLGDNPRIEHQPYMGGEEPGPIVAAYSVAWLKDGTISREVMTKRELDMIRAKSKAKNGPWGDKAFEPEMYRKTVARRHYKTLPHSSDLDEIMQRDDQAFGLEERGEEQIEQRQARRLASTTAALDQFAGGPVIDHEGEPTGEQDTPPAGDQFGEFEDDKRADPPQTQQGEQTAGAATSAETTAETDGNADQKPEAEATAAPAWPLEQLPANAEDYEKYADAKLQTLNSPGEISDWFKGGEQRKLRNDCGVTKDGFDRVREKCAARVAAIGHGTASAKR